MWRGRGQDPDWQGQTRNLKGDTSRYTTVLLYATPDNRKPHYHNPVLRERMTLRKCRRKRLGRLGDVQ